MSELSDIIQELRTKGGFLLVAHGQSGDMGNAPQGNYNVAYENIRQPKEVYSAVDCYINSKVLYYPSQNDTSYIGPILYGNLKKQVSKSVQVKRIVQHPVPREGLLGPLLDFFLDPQTRPEEEIEYPSRLFYEGSETLGSFLTSGNDEEAYFIAQYLALSAPLWDSYQRICPAPILFILGGKDTIEKAINYLRNHPAQYGAFIRALIPSDKFPRTNSLILDRLQAHDQPFLNLDEIQERTTEDLRSICTKLARESS